MSSSFLSCLPNLTCNDFLELCRRSCLSERVLHTLSLQGLLQSCSDTLPLTQRTSDLVSRLLLGWTPVARRHSITSPGVYFYHGSPASIGSSQACPISFQTAEHPPPPAYCTKYHCSLVVPSANPPMQDKVAPRGRTKSFLLLRRQLKTTLLPSCYRLELLVLR